jgi:hypothetical protein
MKFSVAPQSIIAVVWCSVLSCPHIVTLSIMFSSLMYSPVLEIMYGITGGLGVAVVVFPRSSPLIFTPEAPLFLTALPVVLLRT